MDKLRKIEVGIVLLFVIINLLFLIDNPIVTGYLIDNTSLNAPSDFITKENINFENNKVIIEVKDYTISHYAPSGSMVPFLNEYSNGVGIKPNSIDELKVGDIITFRQGERLIVHRIIKKGIDNKGPYVITKGDNNFISDGKIRFDDIESKLIAIFY